METLFVSHENAIKLEEIGFNDPCFGFYSSSGKLKRHFPTEGTFDEFDALLSNTDINVDGYVTAPTHQQVTDWFRNNHNLFVELYLVVDKLPQSGKIYSYIITDLKYNRDVGDSTGGHEGYYDALESAIGMCIKLLKNQIKDGYVRDI